MRVLVAMSGGVDSSVAAALLADEGHEVVGTTLKLWGGASDRGCCSVADTEDARRVAGQLGLDHHVFNLTEAFEEAVVGPYVAEHAAGRTPNPCIACNRHIKFGRLLDRSRRLGFDALATGHHARVAAAPGGEGTPRLRRGVDAAKDQSYVLAMLGPEVLGRLLLPVGERTKAEVRERARALGLRTADKPDSQDVCFIGGERSRRDFLADRTDLHPAELVEVGTGAVVGTVPAMELVTVGQRRGLGLSVDGQRRYAVAVDAPARRITVGRRHDVLAGRVPVRDPAWSGPPLRPGGRARAQTSAHGRAVPGRWDGSAFVLDEPQPRPAPGQTVAFYDVADPELVVGAAIVDAG